jgi:hypothetical protein
MRLADFQNGKSSPRWQLSPRFGRRGDSRATSNRWKRFFPRAKALDTEEGLLKAFRTEVLRFPPPRRRLFFVAAERFVRWLIVLPVVATRTEYHA